MQLSYRVFFFHFPPCYVGWSIVHCRLSVGFPIDTESPLIAPLPIEPVFCVPARDNASPRAILAAVPCNLHRNLGWVHHYLGQLHGTLSRLWLLPFNDTIVEHNVMLPMLDQNELNNEQLWYVIRETWRRTRSRVQHGLRASDNRSPSASDALPAAVAADEFDSDPTPLNREFVIELHESTSRHPPQPQLANESDSPLSSDLLTASPTLALDAHAVSHVQRP